MANLTANQVVKVYSGKDGKCCCGCSGKYSYNSTKVAEGSEGRGYPVDAEDVNDRMVARVIKLLNNTPEADLDRGDGYIATVVGNRLYIAYLSKVTADFDPIALGM